MRTGPVVRFVRAKACGSRGLVCPPAEFHFTVTIAPKPELLSKGKSALLIGKATAVIAAELGGKVNFKECGDLESALALASREALSGDTVLLAPACASYDQFTNYEQRGERFKTLVREL